ncbi:DUF6531 domain-containing protein, partial [Steroidobacter flavus]
MSSVPEHTIQAGGDMVAVVSGSGLGLFGSSVAALGGVGATGNSGLGRGTDRVFVNSVTGNLVVQSQDERLSGFAQDISLVRTYNSQGLMDDDNGDNWRLGVHQRLHSWGSTTNTAGSTVTKVFGDGREVVYSYDTGRQAYVSTDGDGAHDTITYSGGQWTWTDGSSRNSETYDATGRLTVSRDADGNALTYTYTGQQLTRIDDSSGQQTFLDYVDFVNNDLAAIRVVSNGQTQTLTRYYYDNQHRLRQVIVDLTPDDNAVSLVDANSDGLYEGVNQQTYVTTYTYDGTSKRIASIAQSDGSYVAFTYENVGGNYRVKTYATSDQGASGIGTSAERLTTLTYSSSGLLANGSVLSNTHSQTSSISYPLGVQAQGWSPATTLEDGSLHADSPQIAFDAQGNGFAVWAQWDNVYARRYTAATDSWGPLITLDSYNDEAFSPVLSLDHTTGNAIVAWVQSDGTTNRLAVSRFTASTGTWSAASLVGTWSGSGITAEVLDADVSGNHAVIAWVVDNGTTRDLYQQIFSPGLTTTPGLIEASTEGADQVQTQIDSNGNAITVWRQSDGNAERVYFNRWDASSQLYSGAALLENFPDGASWPRIEFDAQGNGIAIWGQWNGLQMRRFDATTETWGAIGPVMPATVDYYGWDMAVDASGNVVVAWTEGDWQDKTLNARRFDAATNSWSSVATLATSVDEMSVAISGSTAVVTWLQLTSGANDVYASRLSGGTWHTPELLETRTEEPRSLNAAVDDDGNISVVWWQDDGVARSVFEARYEGTGGAPSYTVPSGATWQSIANEFYGVNSVEAGEALRIALGNPTLTTGAQLTNLPSTLTVTTTQTVTVPPYYTVQAGDTWASITQAIYGTNAAAAVTALQTQLGNPTLTTGLELTIPTTLYVGSGGGVQTDVEDALGLITTYTHDSSGRLTRVLSPTVNGSRIETRYAYDAAGNLTSITEDPTGLNRITTYGYDANGNLTLTRDSAGDTITRTYDSNNQLLTETRYAGRDPDGAGSGQPTDPKTTHYVYDAESHLRFVISPEGRVTERQYDVAGRLDLTRTFTAAEYAGSNFAENDLATWVGSVDRSQMEQVLYAYDFRGNVSKITRYSATNTAGQPVGTAIVSRFVYDQRGQLLQAINPRGEGGVPNDYLTSYTYDGLGRVLTVTEWLDSSTTRTTINNAYDDSGRVTRTTLANGLLTTRSYNHAGELIRVDVGTAATPAGLGTTKYAYDADGRLRMQTDPSGARHFFYYDDAGRQIAQVDGDGSLVEFVYNRAGQRIKTIEYAALISSATPLVDGSNNPTNVALSTLRTAAGGNAANDRITRNVYDVTGALVYTIDASGAVIENRYDGAGRLTDVIQYANRIIIARTVDEVLPSAVTVTTHDDNRRTRYFHDADGLVIGALDGEGYLTEYSYDGAGNPIEQIRYANQSAVGVRATGTFADLKSSVGTDTETTIDSERDEVTYSYYDGLGRLTGVLDAEGYLTETQYDAGGNVSKRIRYDQVLPYRSSVSQLRGLVSSTTVRETTDYTYNGEGKVTSEVVTRGTPTAASSVTTTYSYDLMGNLVSSTRAAGSDEARTTDVRYDILGRVIQELSAEGHQRITLE